MKSTLLFRRDDETEGWVLQENEPQYDEGSGTLAELPEGKHWVGFTVVNEGDLDEGRDIYMKEAIDRIRIIAKRDQKSDVQMALKISEECGELARIVLIRDGADGTAYRDAVQPEDVAEEMADILICVFALAEKMKISDIELRSMMQQKMNKWERVIGPEKEVL